MEFIVEDIINRREEVEKELNQYFDQKNKKEELLLFESTYINRFLKQTISTVEHKFDPEMRMFTMSSPDSISINAKQIMMIFSGRISELQLKIQLFDFYHDGIKNQEVKEIANTSSILSDQIVLGLLLSSDFDELKDRYYYLIEAAGNCVCNGDLFSAEQIWATANRPLITRLFFEDSKKPKPIQKIENGLRILFKPEKNHRNLRLFAGAKSFSLPQSIINQDWLAVSDSKPINKMQVRAVTIQQLLNRQKWIQSNKIPLILNLKKLNELQSETWWRYSFNTIPECNELEDLSEKWLPAGTKKSEKKLLLSPPTKIQKAILENQEVRSFGSKEAEKERE